MARLNDPPQPAGETLEGLKRRFVRQNRELARVNSTQSVRIRNLEGEVSRLLAENVSLRQQVIKLHNDLEETPGHLAWEKVDSLKHNLEFRLTELGSLLQELGCVKERAVKENAARRKSTNRTSPKRSPNQRQWKNNLTLSEVTRESDGRLPPILEEQHLLQRTLDPVKAPDSAFDTGNLTDSPDLGPPPVAHFDDNEPVKFQSGPPVHNQITSSDISSKKIPTNFEVRRKRRESFHQQDKEGRATSHVEDKSPPEATRPPKGPKPGSKRKLNIRDDEDRQKRHAEKQQPDSQHRNMGQETVTTKPSTKLSSEEKTSIKKKDWEVEAQVTKSTEDRTRPSSVVRKALAPKSGNTDPQSPVKRANNSLKEKPRDNFHEPIQNLSHRDQVKSKGSAVLSSKGGTKAGNLEKQDSTSVLPPKTPVPEGFDLFSPTISDPSEPRPERGDTPPPPDLGPDSGTGSFGRASRRSRGSISYAEPNLRDKMRRPTKELTDAVCAADHARQSVDDRRDDNVSSLEVDLSRQKIKQEISDELQTNWQVKPIQESKSQQARQQAESNSPLGNKTNVPAAALPASVVTDRRRRASSVSRKEEEEERNPSGSASAIAALSGSSQRHARHRVQGNTGGGGAITAINEKSERTSIFDFTSSSPEHEKPDVAAKPTRFSRRHSSVPVNGEQGRGSITISRQTRERLANNDDDTNATESAEVAKPSRPVTHEGVGGGSLGRTASRRRSMMI